MFKTIVFSAFGAALAICLWVTALQFVTTEPLILHAEAFEGGAAGAHGHAPAASLPNAAIMHAVAREADARLFLAHTAAAEGGAEEWGPADGLERSLFTALANLVIGFSISLMLLSAMVLKGEPIDARRGLLWGIAGFAAVSLLPALGLPPELPGTPAADIYARQFWWLGAAAASAGGIAFLVFARNWGLLALGLVLIIAPHVIGAPVPPSHDVTYPGALAGEFAVASLVASALLWSLAGLVSGGLYQRFSAPA
jgi:cobalt transporter subunit CbtA